jgi:hypothetical protein
MYMQRHWEDTILAKECLVFSGDEIPHGESAFVISVCILWRFAQASSRSQLTETEPPSLFRLLPRSSAS